MRSRLFISFCLVLILAASGRASWSGLSNGEAIACDFFNSHLGLVVFNDGSVSPPILRYNGSTFTGVFSGGSATQIIIQDTNRAWAFVRGQTPDATGIYIGTNHWATWTQTMLTLPSAPHFVGATPSALFFFMLGNLYWTSNGDTAIQAIGINHGDSIIALDYLSSSIIVAVSQNAIYRSIDGGTTWTPTLEINNGNNVYYESVFADRMHSWVYTGGDAIRKSTDSGQTWTVIVPPQGFNVTSFSGEVFGSHDCTGMLYVANFVKDVILRSRDGGISVEDAGSIPSRDDELTKAWAFDRGSTVFWLGTRFQDLIYVSHDGTDGLISDSIGIFVSIALDTVYDTICAEQKKSFNIYVSSLICTPIEIDSIRVIKSVGTIATTFTPIVISGDSAVIPLTYSGEKNGYDSVALRLSFHGLDDGVEEHSDFPVTAFSLSPPAVLVSTDSLQFGNVQLLNSKKLTIEISNSGCSRLIVDSVVSSNPNSFELPKPDYAFSIGADSTAKIDVTFSPMQIGESIESIELRTSAGHKFIELVGAGVAQPPSIVASPVENANLEIFPNPASSTIYVRNVIAGSTYKICDLLGRVLINGVIVSGANEISTAHLGDGVYIFHAAGFAPERIIISRK